MTSASDLRRYAKTQPTTFKWTSADNSTSPEQVKDLERSFGVPFRNTTGALNYLSNTFVRGIFTTRKLCKYMHSPGPNHFKALIHFLNHIRAWPARANVYYHRNEDSPLFKLLCDARQSGGTILLSGNYDESADDCAHEPGVNVKGKNANAFAKSNANSAIARAFSMKTEGSPNGQYSCQIPLVDPTIVWFTDSSHADANNQQSTGCHMGFIQGGVVNFASFVPLPIPGSSAESESNALCVGVLAAAHACQAFCDVVFDNSLRPLTVPFLIDSSAALAMSQNEKSTSRTKHIDRRWLIHRYARMNSDISLHHISGDLYNVADLGTKGLAANDEYKLSILEHAPLDEGPTVCATEEGC
jgi:hypothetical protein